MVYCIKKGGREIVFRLASAALLAALAATLVAPSAQAAFPGATGKIAFVSSRTSPGGLFMMNSDGSQQGAIPTPAINRDPAWSANGQRLAFIGHPPDTVASEDVHIINADGTGRRRLTFDGGMKRSPTWSPDGTKIAYEKAGIQIARVDGSGGSFLVAGSQPSWSPDGTELVFRGDGGLWIINADGTGLQRLTTDAGEHPDHSPDWSPNGERIVFHSGSCTHFCVGNDGPILAVDRDGTNRTMLDSGADNDAAWSPDGTKIVFTRELGLPGQTSSLEIFVMNADGTDQTQLTFNGGVDPATGWPTGPADEDPTWQPLGALDPYPRPGGATPLRVSLVPSFTNCTNPNSSHVPPLAEPSCTPPTLESSQLTTSRNGAQSAVARLDVMAGNPATPANEADVDISASATDVQCVAAGSPGCTSAGGDYSGKTVFSTVLRITDRANGPGGVSGTIGDFRFDVPVDCLPTPTDPAGSSCNVDTTANSLVPGFAVEGQRAVISSYTLKLLDQGPDGSITPRQRILPAQLRHRRRGHLPDPGSLYALTCP